ncbi:amylosucrase [Sphingomonas oleivorans]|uniref:Amylosucrase n=1 Tax=Sphingomonas oleivorans TaxID=1735121 RepID=A0A2T5G0K1_9SPHN|nr:alpha-amylase family glycosyl hydrolase [Sphingomonas oleivorans]PTQ12679.1 amylosucrase [Sphingomonas oleivorans]
MRLSPVPQSPLASAAFDMRLARHGARLDRQLQALYGATPDAAELPARVRTLLRARFEERPEELLALDAAREARPDWFVDPAMLGYSTYVDRFGSTVAGVESRVDYLENLGVRYLHLLALLKAREGDSDGGFAVADYLAVEPALGSMADLERLTARLRRARISLCVDFALNHTADDHHWAKAAKAGDPHYRDFYIVLDDEAEVAAREARLGQIFPKTAPGNFTYIPELKGWAWTTFYPFQWDLNWANPELFLAMLDALLTLANRGIEAFRLDSIAFLWKEAGTDCRNLPLAHVVVRALRAALDIVAPGVLLKAEAIVPTRHVLPYFGGEEGGEPVPECHLVYNNSLMVSGWAALAEGDARLPLAIQQESAKLPPNANWLSYSRCHDDIGWGALLGDLAAIDPAPEARLKAVAAMLEGRSGGWGRGEAFQTDGDGLHGTNGTMASLAGLEAAGEDPALRERAFARIRLLNALAIASGGLATLYMGDETGVLNDRTYLADPEKAHEGRWLHRPVMDWSATTTPDAARIGGDIAALLAARIASGGAGNVRALDSRNPAVLALACGMDIVLLNFSPDTTTVDIGLTSWRDRLGKGAGTGMIDIGGLDVIWAARE